ncbi:MAG: hypothetical protein DMG79_01475 [Acidobacteria bacterium]|nr:MAG: hypothetical protein DMG79_01475 [Acidobacteriota bacterium]
MCGISKFAICLIVIFAGAISCVAQARDDIESPKHKAWDMLVTATLSKVTTQRMNGTRALGLLQDTPRAREMAENSLKDPKPEVREAAATALGQMHSRESIPKLEQALSDPKIRVVMAAANSLRMLKDDKSAYAVYYDLLTGERKSGDGMIAQQMETLKNPKELAKIGISEGIGYIPFAGIGWDAYRAMHKKDPNPVRAAAATFLAHDPDPATSRALVNATRDKNWIVRAAAVESIAQRGDASLQPALEERFTDKNEKVRYSAAAAVIRLSSPEALKTARNAH